MQHISSLEDNLNILEGWNEFDSEEVAHDIEELAVRFRSAIDRT